MSLAQTLETRLRGALDPVFLELTNESQRHNVPPDSETHFRALIVSDAFDGKSLVQRHRAVYQAVGEQLHGALHALALRTLTRQEWEREDRPQDHQTPPCRGGSASE